MKRLLDALLSLAALLLLAPLLMALGLLIRRRLGHPVLFSQLRAGKDGRPFRLYKFRSMTEARDEDGALLPDADRLTPFGQKLRCTSLDELPQLWNVLKGDMSLVGPRPLLLDYVPLYSERQRQRLNVKPGLTGWAQIKGRNTLSWEEKFELDVWYVERQSLWLDLKILLQTVGSVLRRKGISASGEATMPRFTGSGRRTD
ncbi:MAG: sugar transferase [Fretibacterium sp.]|nr:sugar transferase [Fretibacterium sp.]